MGRIKCTLQDKEAISLKKTEGKTHNRTTIFHENRPKTCCLRILKMVLSFMLLSCTWQEQRYQSFRIKGSVSKETVVLRGWESIAGNLVLTT